MKIGLIGAGNMARAMARGWGEPVLCSDTGSGRAQALVDELGGEAFAQRRARRARRPRRALPQALPARAVARDRGHGQGGRSVLGGTSTAHAAGRLPGHAGVRADAEHAGRGPRGVVVYAERVGRGPASARRRSSRRRCWSCSALGRVVTVPSADGRRDGGAGVGPAYQALLAEAQVDAAVRYGLQAGKLAAELVVETMSGQAALLAHAATTRWPSAAR
jgi:pyrroline-5-carboxylate reductase